VIPETRYARAPDGAFIAFQVFGSGPIDVLLMPGFLTNLDENWRIPEIADAHRRIGSFARVIAMDRRGVGLSDRLSPHDAVPLETHVDDVVAVLDAAKARDVCIVTSESGSPLLALLFAAAHPDRVRAVALYTPIPSSPLVAMGADPRADTLGWGSEAFARQDLETAAPSVAGDQDAVRSWAAYLRSAASPGSAAALKEQWSETDIRDVLPLVRAPTLILSRPGGAHIEKSRPFIDAILSAIPHARSVELDGRDLPYWFGDRGAFVAELEEFFTGARRPVDDGRRGLATVLFTDIVDSTALAASLGDAAWNATRGRHDEIIRRAVDRQHGREIKTLGDGFLVAFDGPARAVRCALDIVQAVRPLGLEVRAGLHAGEVNFEGNDISGIAVHIGARIAAIAGRSEVLVSSTVKELVAGSGLTFEDAGEHGLKGVPDPWRLYRAT
jgi:class 3 adenylate cyclase/pimeloyl-ACP methyl ester carboxylesterase